VDALKGCRGALFGAVTSPSHKVPGYSSPIVAMRRIFDLYANVRPCISAPAVVKAPGSQQGVNMLIFRENTECLYVKDETLSDDGLSAVAKRVITRAASERIATMAFEAAEARSKQSGKQGMVTIVHKSNVLAVTDGLFRETCLEVAKKFPQVKVEEQLGNPSFSLCLSVSLSLFCFFLSFFPWHSFFFSRKKFFSKS